MPASYCSNHQRRIRRTSIEYRNNYQLKLFKPKFILTVKLIKLISAILVPVMIGIFTIITTLQESQRIQLQRNSDIEKIERQAQLQREMDALKMKEQQEYEENNLREIRIQNIYDAFIRDMSSVVLKYNQNLTRSEVIFARAKTLATLEQIDPKRKWYLVKFLYDSQLLYANKSGMRYIDLADADLSNVKFSIEKRLLRQLDLEDIRLSRVQLRNALFENMALRRANFQYSTLNNSNFIDVSIVEGNFKNTFLENAKLVLDKLQYTLFQESHLRLSSWSSVTNAQSYPWSHINFSRCDLSDSRFQGMKLEASINFDQANLERISFSDVKFSAGTKFKDLHMPFSKFRNVTLINGEFYYCNMTGTIIDMSHFSNIVFNHVDLQQSQFNNISNSIKMKFNNTNLIGSNLNVTNEGIIQIVDSFLPNKTFKTLFTKFGINLIENSDAEQGQCYNVNQTSKAATPYGWFQQNDVIQMYYKNNNWTVDITNYTNDWGECFFSGGDIYSTKEKHLKVNAIRQEINIQQLSVLIDSRQAKFYASAYLGGFRNEPGSTSMKIDFKNMKNKTINNVRIGSITNIDRRNKTTMLFRSTNGTIPNHTTIVEIELKFQQHTGQSPIKFGMADNLKFIIKQKSIT